MITNEERSMIGMKCEYCGMEIKDKPWFAPVKKELLGRKYVFCTENCFVCFRYEVPKDRVLGIQGWGV